MSTLIYLVHQINFLQGLKRPHITQTPTLVGLETGLMLTSQSQEFKPKALREIFHFEIQ